MGCGIASAAFIVLLFAAGAWLSGGGASRLMGWALQMIHIDLGSMYAKDVTAAEKKAVDDELLALEHNVEQGKVAVTSVQGVMATLRPAISDQKLTRDEVQQLIKVTHEVNAKAKAPAQPKPRS